LTWAKVEMVALWISKSKDVVKFLPPFSKDWKLVILEPWDIKEWRYVRIWDEEFVITKNLWDKKLEVVAAKIYEWFHDEWMFKNIYEKSKEIYDLSSELQPAIKLTPEIKAKIRWEAIPIKKPSWKSPFEEPRLKRKVDNIEDSLINEAKKYKTWEEFYQKMPANLRDELSNINIRWEEQITKHWEDITWQKSVRSYTMSHRPTKTWDAAYDITETWETMPKDFYNHPEYYTNIKNKWEYWMATKESFDILKKIKWNPNAEITIYRSTPSESINNWDWVTLSKKYAKLHNKTWDNIITLKVKAKDVHFAGDDINEFWYFPFNQ